MSASTNKVFIDTGAFIAVAATRDLHHSRASDIYRQLIGNDAELYTTNHVIDETCTWLLRDVTLGHPAALRFGDFIRDASVAVTVESLADRSTTAKGMIVVYSSPEIERIAWEILARYDTAGFTFTDCTSFATMRVLSISKALAFDHHFDLMGFERL